VVPLHRFDEDNDIPNRSERFYQIDGEWFFAVRRGEDQGPYRSKEEARAALRTYIVEKLAEEKQNRPKGGRFSLKSLSY